MAQHDIQQLLSNGTRDYLIGKNGDNIPIASLKDKVVGLYFSAHWCPPCRGFTPVLTGVYKELIAEKKPFEIVFISSDSDEKSFEEYFGEMPWLAVPFVDKEIKGKLSALFQVEGIPTFVVLGADGSLITVDARSAVSRHGAAGFPWPEKQCAPLDDRLDALNKGACLLGLIEDASEEDKKTVIAQMNAIVEAKSPLVSGLTLLYATKHTPMVTRVRQFFALEVATNVPHEHPLTVASKKGWQCDVCHKTFRSAAGDHECRQCNYDECDECFATRQADKTPRALLKPQLLLLDSSNRTKLSYTGPLFGQDSISTFLQQWKDGTAQKLIKSDPRPANDADPEHPGLTIVVANSFHEICLNSKQSVLLDVSADWCPPCQAFKPELLRAAKVLQDMQVKNLLIASLDIDTNDVDVKYLPETTIPNIKFFHRGADPIKYAGQRSADGVLTFLHEKVKGTDSEFDLEEAKKKLAETKPADVKNCGGGCACGGDKDEEEGGCCGGGGNNTYTVC